MPDQKLTQRKLTLITGRSTEQGTGISNGKELESYRTATSVLQLNAADMERFGLQPGAQVKVKTIYGEAILTCQPDKLPEGLAFLAFGPASSELVGGETHASGMPDTKGFEIELEPVPA